MAAESGAVYEDALMTIWRDGRIETRVNNVADAKHLLRTFKLVKRALRISQKDVNAELRKAQREYKERLGPTVRGKSGFDILLRLASMALDESVKRQHEATAEPLLKQKEMLGELLANIERRSIELELFAHRQGR